MGGMDRGWLGGGCKYFGWFEIITLAECRSSCSNSSSEWMKVARG